MPIPVCQGDPLGAGHGGALKKSAFSASSFYGGQNPHFGRLHGSSGWCSDTIERGTFFQVDLGFVVSVCALETQGIKEDNDWIRNFFVEYSEDGVKWLTVQENNVNKVCYILSNVGLKGAASAIGLNCALIGLKCALIGLKCALIYLYCALIGLNCALSGLKWL